MSRNIGFKSLTSSFSSDQDSAVFNDTLRNYVKDLFRSRLFLGRYVERRYVNEEIGYRDVIIISPAEVEFNRDLEDVSSKLRAVYKCWIGINDIEVLGVERGGLSLWVDFLNQPLGAFWFQVKTVSFKSNEIVIKLKCIRHITERFLELEPLLTKRSQTKMNKSKVQNDEQEDPDNDFISFLHDMKSHLTFRSVKEVVKFMSLLVIALFTGSIQLVNFLGNFIIALIRESSIFIKSSTPMFIGVMDFFGKIIGGFYILLAMILGSNRTPRFNNQYDPRYGQRKSYTETRAITYTPEFD